MAALNGTKKKMSSKILRHKGDFVKYPITIDVAQAEWMLNFPRPMCRYTHLGLTSQAMD